MKILRTYLAIVYFFSAISLDASQLPKEIMLNIAKYTTDPKFDFISKEERELSGEAKIDNLVLSNIQKSYNPYEIPTKALSKLMPNVAEKTLQNKYRLAFISRINFLLNSNNFFDFLLDEQAVKFYLLHLEDIDLFNKIFDSLKFDQKNLRDDYHDKNDLYDEFYHAVILAGISPEEDEPKITNIVSKKKEDQTIKDFFTLLKQNGFYDKRSLKNEIKKNYKGEKTLGYTADEMSQLRKNYGIIFQYKSVKTFGYNVTCIFTDIDKKKYLYSWLILSLKTPDLSKLFAYIKEREDLSKEERAEYLNNEKSPLKIIFNTLWLDILEKNNVNLDWFNQLVNESNSINNKYNITDKKNSSLLSVALLLKNAEISKHLLNNGAWWNTDLDGNNLLHFAAIKSADTSIKVEQSFLEIFEKILQNPFSTLLINKQNKILEQYKPEKANKTPLHLAVINNYLQIAELFLKYGAKTDIADALGNTPLHYACMNNDIAMVRLLIKNGANSGQENNKKETPLSIAKAAKNEELLSALTGY